MWTLFGGALEPGEPPEDGLKRELTEELEFAPKESRLWTVKMIAGYLAYLFEVELDKDITQLRLHEGIDMGLFTKQQIDEITLAFKYNPVLEEYFKEKK